MTDIREAREAGAVAIRAYLRYRTYAEVDDSDLMDAIIAALSEAGITLCREVLVLHRDASVFVPVSED